MIYGYHRTSTEEQHLDRGIKAIADYCNQNNIVLDVMFTDQQTGKNFNRPDYQAMKRIAKKQGDIIILSEIDRLGRDKQDTLKELQHFKSVGVRVMILEIPTTLVDCSKQGNTLSSMLMDTINNMLIEMYTTFAHAEMIKRENRQKEGIQAKKDRDEWDDYGRPKAMSFEIFSKAYTKVTLGEVKPFECMRNLGLSTATFYRYKKQYEQAHMKTLCEVNV